MKEENKELFRSIFLAFTMGVFFYLLNQMTEFFSLSSLGKTGVVIWFSLSLLFIFFLLGYRFPWLLHINDKETIKFFKRGSIFFGIISLILYLISMASFMIHQKAL